MVLTIGSILCEYMSQVHVCSTFKAILYDWAKCNSACTWLNCQVHLQHVFSLCLPFLWKRGTDGRSLYRSILLLKLQMCSHFVLNLCLSTLWSNDVYSWLLWDSTQGVPFFLILHLLLISRYLLILLLHHVQLHIDWEAHSFSWTVRTARLLICVITHSWWASSVWADSKRRIDRNRTLWSFTLEYIMRVDYLSHLIPLVLALHFHLQLYHAGSHLKVA